MPPFERYICYISQLCNKEQDWPGPWFLGSRFQGGSLLWTGPLDKWLRMRTCHQKEQPTMWLKSWDSRPTWPRWWTKGARDWVSHVDTDLVNQSFCKKAKQGSVEAWKSFLLGQTLTSMCVEGNRLDSPKTQGTEAWDGDPPDLALLLFSCSSDLHPLYPTHPKDFSHFHWVFREPLNLGSSWELPIYN